MTQGSDLVHLYPRAKHHKCRKEPWEGGEGREGGDIIESTSPEWLQGTVFLTKPLVVKMLLKPLLSEVLGSLEGKKY